jgi:hypothetical protein
MQAGASPVPIRSLRSISARAGENGLQIFTLPQVAARLAGGR